MVWITYYNDGPLDKEPIQDSVDDDTDTDVVEPFGIMTFVFAPLLALLLLAAVIVLFRDRKYSFACGAWYSPSRFLSFTWAKRFVILIFATLLVSLQIDSVTLLLYFAILYCCILHDFIWRRTNCPEDWVSKAVGNLFNVDKNIAALKTEVANLAGNVQKLWMKTLEHAQYLKDQALKMCTDVKDTVVQYGSKLSEKGKEVVSGTLQRLSTGAKDLGDRIAESKDLLTTKAGELSESAQQASLEAIQSAVAACSAVYNEAKELTGALTAGVYEYFVPAEEKGKLSTLPQSIGSLAAPARKKDSVSYGGIGEMFAAASKEHSRKYKSFQTKQAAHRRRVEYAKQLFDARDVDEGRRYRAEVRKEHGMDPAVGVGFLGSMWNWAKGVENDDVLDQQLAANLGFKSVSDLPVKLPEKVILQGQSEGQYIAPRVRAKTPSKSFSMPMAQAD